MLELEISQRIELKVWKGKGKARSDMHWTMWAICCSPATASKPLPPHAPSGVETENQAVFRAPAVLLPESLRQ